MPEETPDPSSAVYKPAAPAGLASEITAGLALPAGAADAFGGWLKEKLASGSDVREGVVAHSGLAAAELSSLAAGQSDTPLNRDHIQRIASALVEMGLISHADEAWNAAGLGSSDYLVPPGQIVQAMSRG